MKLKKIKIPESFTETPPRPWKMMSKYGYYIENGEFQSDIVVNKKNELVNGYTSYLLAKMFGVKEVDVVKE